MFVRVRVLKTGHQVDIVESHFDPERHERVRRYPPVRVPRKPKFRVTYQRKTSAPKAVEGEALPIEAGTGNKEVGP